MTIDLLEPVAMLEDTGGLDSLFSKLALPPPSVTNRSTPVKRERISYLVSDQTHRRDEGRDRSDGLGLSERFPHTLDWDLAPCTERELLKFEWTVLNAPELSHFMPQCLEQPSDLIVLPLGQDHFPDAIRVRNSSESSHCGTGGARHSRPLRL